MPPDASPGGQETALTERLVFLDSCLSFLSERDWEARPQPCLTLLCFLVPRLSSVLLSQGL